MFLAVHTQSKIKLVTYFKVIPALNRDDDDADGDDDDDNDDDDEHVGRAYH